MTDLDLGPRTAEARRLMSAWLAFHYGVCPRCAGPRGPHLTRPILRCEAGC